VKDLRNTSLHSATGLVEQAVYDKCCKAVVDVVEECVKHGFLDAKWRTDVALWLQELEQKTVYRAGYVRDLEKVKLLHVNEQHRKDRIVKAFLDQDVSEATLSEDQRLISSIKQKKDKDQEKNDKDQEKLKKMKDKIRQLGGEVSTTENDIVSHGVPADRDRSESAAGSRPAERATARSSGGGVHAEPFVLRAGTTLDGVVTYYICEDCEQVGGLKGGHGEVYKAYYNSGLSRRYVAVKRPLDPTRLGG
jgi:hypothetical protein